jgi:hypothetical protein
MKNKPLPAATLIVRLKEKRLQREQAAETRQPETPVLDVEARAVDSTESPVILPPESPGAELARHEPLLRRSGSLLYSQISIDDLRPSTDDYDALTEEIRLAGRFAAIGLIAQGLRLSRIRQNEIHKQRYTSFEDYCRAEHQMSATYAYRLIRMSEMAEKLSERPIESLPAEMPHPYEVMLNLGHRHLMALLPLSEDKVEEFLIMGIPLKESESEGDRQAPRVPIARATEKQIRQALRPDTRCSTSPIDKRAAKFLTRELPELVEIIEQCAEWLDTSPAEMEMAKMERRAELKKLADRFKKAGDRIFKSLS